MSRLARINVTSADMLIAWRERYGLTREEMAALVFRAPRTYYNIERGITKKFPPHIDMVCRGFERTHKPVMQVVRGRLD